MGRLAGAYALKCRAGKQIAAASVGKDRRLPGTVDCWLSFFSKSVTLARGLGGMGQICRKTRNLEEGPPLQQGGSVRNRSFSGRLCIRLQKFALASVFVIAGSL
jgi:hypothetical protein